MDKKKGFTKAHRTFLTAIVCILILAGCAGSLPPPRPSVEAAGPTVALAPPECGARIFVTLGLNQKYAQYPDMKNLHPKRGELYVNGTLVDVLTGNPEMSVVDVPPGKTEIRWMDPDLDFLARGKTQQNPRVLTLGDRETAFIVLDWYDGTTDAFGAIGALATMAYRTEVTETRDTARFAGKRVVFHKPLQAPDCSAPSVSAPAVVSSWPILTTSPIRQEQLPAPRAGLHYIVKAQCGAPAFAAASAVGLPLHTFTDGSELNVIEVSADERWLKVLIPDGRAAFVPTSIVKVDGR